MAPLLNAMLVIVLLINLFALGTSRIRALVHAAAVQGVVLGTMPVIVHGGTHATAMIALVAAAIALSSRLPLAAGHAQTLIVPAAFSTMFTGFLLLTTRIKAITQAIGYLILENGIFIFGLLLLEAVPFFVELGVLLDLFVGVFVISIIIHHINREFASLDTRRLSALKE